MIKNIILDIGEVLLDYRWLDMLMDHGLTKERAIEIGDAMFDDPLWDELDLDEKPLEQILDAYRAKYPDYADEISWFLLHGELMHVPRVDVWQKVHQLKEKGYKIYLLSNYSEILFTKHTKGASFIEDADGMVVSYQIHKTKPDPDIYLYLLNKYSLNPEECIFFDDRIVNTKGAEKVGIHSVTVQSKEVLLEQLNML